MNSASPFSSPAVRQPPWLWVYFIADLLIGIPQSISGIKTTYDNYEPLPSGPVGSVIFLKVFLLVSTLPVLFLLAGIASVALPGLRGRWVERHHQGQATPSGPALQIQAFLDRHAPGVQLRLSPNGGQLARIYPIGWRSARIAAFGPFLSLWGQDRAAAEAVLLHEIAHLRQGEYLIIGLGSPFSWLVRTWGAVFLVLTAIPIAVLLLIRDPLAVTLSGQVLLDVTLPLRLLLLPVAAIWLAELTADDWAGESSRPEAVLSALAPGRSPVPLWRRALSVLDHPPRRVRRAALTGHLRESGLLAAWPAAIVLKLVLVVVVAIPAWLLIATPLREVPGLVARGAHDDLVDARPVAIVCAALLLLWPTLSRRWASLWSPSMIRAAGLPLRPYLVAAVLPAALVVAAAVLVS